PVYQSGDLSHRRWPTPSTYAADQVARERAPRLQRSSPIETGAKPSVPHDCVVSAVRDDEGARGERRDRGAWERLGIRRGMGQGDGAVRVRPEDRIQGFA